jgi:ADP-heptose:LPS heptosyltransferase
LPQSRPLRKSDARRGRGVGAKIPVKDRKRRKRVISRLIARSTFARTLDAYSPAVSGLPSNPIPTHPTAGAFPEGTPLNAFFAWNEARRVRDRRYIIACDIYRLLRKFYGRSEIPTAHLAGHPVILWRAGRCMVISPTRVRGAYGLLARTAGSPAVAAARCLVDRLLAALGSPDVGAHAAVFQAFEEVAMYVDLDAAARLRPRCKSVPPSSRRREILIIKLGALGDFIQALGPMPEIRAHHGKDRISLLTTPRYAELARQTRLFDEILIDHRPKALDINGWVALRRMLRRGRFDRVYDLQTSDRSGIYAWLFQPGRMPEWSGVAWHCSHPHANSGRDRQHTMDRQSEQLLMAGIHPVSLVPWLPAAGPLPAAIAGRRFAMLIPGSSPRHLAKRWPVGHYGALAMRLHRAGYLPVVVGVHGEEEALGHAIRGCCPETIDLVGRTDVAGLAALAKAATLTVGNDTGATHVAAAGGNPVVVLFSRASVPSLCAPRGKAVHVLVEPNLAELPVATVFAACMSAASAEAVLTTAP